MGTAVVLREEISHYHYHTMISTVKKDDASHNLLLSPHPLNVLVSCHSTERTRDMIRRDFFSSSRSPILTVYSQYGTISMILI
jgi:hypothetical protein